MQPKFRNASSNRWPHDCQMLSVRDIERFCVKYVRFVNEKCGILRGFPHCVHTLSRTPGSESGSGELGGFGEYLKEGYGIMACVLPIGKLYRGVSFSKDKRSFGFPEGLRILLCRGRSEASVSHYSDGTACGTRWVGCR